MTTPNCPRCDTTNIRNRLEASANSGNYNARNFVDVPAHELRALLAELDAYRADAPRTLTPQPDPAATEVEAWRKAIADSGGRMATGQEIDEVLAPDPVAAPAPVTSEDVFDALSANGIEVARHLERDILNLFRKFTETGSAK